VLFGTGAVMALLVLAAAVPVSRFYGSPTMVDIMLVIAINFVANPFGSMTYAWLMREMRFETLAAMRFSASLAGAAVSVLLTWQGHGPISLAYGSLAGTLVNAAVGFRLRPAGLTLWPSFKEVRRVIGFGSRISATSLIGSATSGTPELMLGKLQGLQAAGLYSRSNGLASMFQRLVLDAVNAVALPLFAKAQRESGSPIEPWLKAVSYVTALGWSFFGGLALLSFPATRLLYGDQWDASVDATRLLALGFAVGLPAGMCPLVLMGIGQVQRMLKLTLAALVLQLGLVGLGAAHSLEGAALGFAAAQATGLVLWLCATHAAAPFSWRGLFAALAQSAKLAATVCLGPAIAVFCFGWSPTNPWPALLVGVSLGLALFLGSLLWFAHPLAAEIASVSKRFAGMLRGPR
jgi:O-antigen/teichoic acid export membrane protein